MLESRPAPHSGVGVRRRSIRDSASEFWWLLPVLVGGAIRFATLGHQSFWGDETATLAILHHSLGSLLHTVRVSESTPPLYYYLAWFWVHIFGFTEVGLRSLSAVFGTATIAVVAVIARRLGGVRAAIAAAWLVATAPMLFWLSQEARSYALFVLLSAASLGLMLALRRRPSLGNLLGWTAICVADVATHYFAGFLVGAELFALLVLPGTMRRRMLLGPSLAFAAAALPLALLAHAQYPNSSFVRGLSIPNAVAQTTGQLLVGYGVDPVMVASALVSGIGLAGSMWPLVRQQPRLRGEVAPLALALGLAVTAPVLVAIGGAQLIDSRNMVFALPGIVLLAAVGATVVRHRWTVLLPILAGFAVVVHVYFDPTLQRTDLRGVAATIGQAHGTRAILMRMSGTAALEPYIRSVAPVGHGGARVNEIVFVGMTMGGGLNRHVEPLDRLRFAAPAGFREVQALTARTFTLRRYVRTEPSFETVRGLKRRAGGDVQVLLQRGVG